MTDITVTREEGETKGRFVAVVESHEAELTFSKTSPTLVIADHTGVPEELKGKGVGRALVEALVADARASGYKVIPLCPFVKAQYGRHPEWSDVFG
ncbi:GNAT family N-acetyltransferase [Marinibacterium profundimaris]|uniref:Acetyltransferase n=1 Tax=Marinibacterium profundimaris TaxID=1679460 RepID=A0A225NF91_9RHOB|nr:GNAT family N-acetyltransferase [Marinibacterium profundimaris]OWU71677.1 acetyltransferase [Marinibacterium profundimaris]